MMQPDLGLPLARLRPRDQLFYVSRNRTVLATARDGFIHGQGQEGLYVAQTRLLSTYRYWINGATPQTVGVSNVEEHSQIAYYVVASPSADKSWSFDVLGPGGLAAAESIELRLARIVSDGFEETVYLVNHTLRTAHLTLELELDSDFADPMETHGDRKQSGHLDWTWRHDGDTSQLCWTYTAAHDYSHQGNTGRATLRRQATLTLVQPDTPATYDRDRQRIRFEIDLPPRAEWQCSAALSADIDGRSYQPARYDGDFYKVSRYDELRNQFLTEGTRIDIEMPDLAFVVRHAVEQARRDLVGLRLFDLDRRDGGWLVAAGLPVYIAVFGRDTLTTSWQSALLDSAMMRGTLAYLSETQGAARNDWRDEQPGRIVHQMDTGPLATLMYNPNSRYYGSITGPGFYPVVVSNLWHWTGDRDVVRPFLEPALRGLAWLDNEALLDHGFYAYQTRSEQGVKNQAWKDSCDAIIYPDGSQVDDPIAPTEFQAFVFAAKVRMSELLWWFDRKDESRRFFDQAMDFRERFNRTFYLDEEGCFGMGLDPRGQLIRSVGSESAHAIAAGIVELGRVEATVNRLFRDDLFSGWGLRTLSALHAAFNPFSYHRGSVWPAEQAAFSMGLMRYGLHDRLHQLTKAQFEAASLFEYCRLPELFSGHQRDAQHPMPALYPLADSPQAWSASAVPCMIQAMLGLFPYAPLNALFLDPHLPDWLPQLRLTNVRVAEAAVDLEFLRAADGTTSYHVSQLRGKLHVVRQPSPWSMTTSLPERLIDAMSGLLPGH
jgi:glycogen debranching enzyme